MTREEMCAKLRELRVAAHMTQEAVGDALEWSKSKVVRIENLGTTLQVRDLKALLELYKVTDASLIAELTDAARNSQPRRNQKGRPNTARARHGRRIVTLAHAELLQATSDYVSRVLGALADLNAATRDDDREATAEAFGAVLRAAQRGRALRNQLGLDTGNLTKLAPQAEPGHYPVRAVLEDDIWVLHIKDIGATQCETFGKVRRTARDYIACMLDKEESDIRIDLTVEPEEHAPRE